MIKKKRPAAGNERGRSLKAGSVKKKAGKAKAKSLAAAKAAKTRKAKAKLQHIVHPKPEGRKERLAYELREEIQHESHEMFTQHGKVSFRTWMTRYSPVLITMIVGLATYFFLVFYLFYPQTLMYGHYVQLLMLMMFIFFVIGVMIYLGIQAELMFIRIMSFAFVFIIFTFLLIFILLAHSMYG